MSFLPPFAGLKRTRAQAGLWLSALRIADFVADYSCEGSGGFAPRFPNTCGVSDCQCGLTEAELASMPNVISG